MKKTIVAFLCLAAGQPPVAGATGFDEFLPSGKMAVGANYWASKNATKMWREWDPESVERDLETMERAGLTVLRVFPNWADFQPIVEIHQQMREDEPRETVMFLSEERRPDTPAGYAGVDERMMERFETFCKMAERHGFKLIVCIINGQMTFRIIHPPAYEGKNVYTDPYALKWQSRYVEYFVRRTRHLKAISAWEAGDEVICMERTTHRNAPEVWMRLMNEIIRRNDPTRPVLGQNGLWLSPKEPWNVIEQAVLSDGLTTHPYSMWGKPYYDDFNEVRNALFCSAQTLALEHVTGKPAFVEEHGVRRAEQTNKDNLAAYLRGALWNMWAADNRAMLWWCSYNQTGMEFPPYDWAEPCLELGAWTRDRRPYPIARALSAFADLQKRLPFDRLPKAKSDALFIVSNDETVHAATVLARQAGIFPAFQAADQDIRPADCYFLPSAKERAGLTTRRWNQLKERVRAGATLYLSWNDTFLDSLDEVCGIEVDFREATSGADRIALGTETLEISYPVARRFKTLTAETLACNERGEGVFFRNRYGKGTVYVFAHDLEDLVYSKAGQFARQYWKVYETVCPVDRLVKTGCANVMTSEHDFGDGTVAVVIVNNARAPYVGTLTTKSGWVVKSLLTDDAAAASLADGKLSLAGNGGALLMLKRCD